MIVARSSMLAVLLLALLAGSTAGQVNIASDKSVTYCVIPGDWDRRLMEYANWAKVIDADLRRFKPVQLPGSNLVNAAGEVLATATLDPAGRIKTVTHKDWTATVKPAAEYANGGARSIGGAAHVLVDAKGGLRGIIEADSGAQDANLIMLADPQGTIGYRQGLLTDGHTGASAVRYPYINEVYGTPLEDRVLTVEMDLGKPRRIGRIVLYALKVDQSFTLNRVAFTGSADGVRFLTLGDLSESQIAPPRAAANAPSQWLVWEVSCQVGGKPLRYLRVSGWTKRFIDFTEIQIWSND